MFYFGEFENKARVEHYLFTTEITFDEFKQMVAKENSTFLQGLENDTQNVSGTPTYYDNSKGSLYQFAEQQGLNAWEFDVLKRTVRCRKKGNFEEDIKKTIAVLELYLKEYEQAGKNN